MYAIAIFSHAFICLTIGWFFLKSPFETLNGLGTGTLFVSIFGAIFFWLWVLL